MVHRDVPSRWTPDIVLSIRWKRACRLHLGPGDVALTQKQAPQLPSDLSVVTPLGRCVVTCIGRSPPPQVPSRQTGETEPDTTTARSIALDIVQLQIRPIINRPFMRLALLALLCLALWFGVW